MSSRISANLSFIEKKTVALLAISLLIQFSCHSNKLYAASTAFCEQLGGTLACEETVPIVTQWEYLACDEAGAYLGRSQLWCRVLGGSTTSNGGCVGARKINGDGDLLAVATDFETQVRATCDITPPDGITWGDISDSYQCWQLKRSYINGTEVLSGAKLTFSGKVRGGPDRACAYDWTETVYGRRDRKLICPNGYDARYQWIDNQNKNLYCLRLPTYTLNPGPPPNDCPDKEGNPCSPATGNKFQTETDYAAGGNVSLNFSRHYNSMGKYRHGKHLAPDWRPDFSAEMDAAASQSQLPRLAGGDASSAYTTPEAACIEGFAEIKATVWGGTLADASAEYAGGNLCRVFKGEQTLSWFTINGGSSGSYNAPVNIHTLIRANGRLYVFQQKNGQWLDELNPNVKLVASSDNWIFTDSNNTQETYNTSGQLIAITKPSGRTTTLSYDLATGAGGDGNPDTLDQVTDASGRNLTFSYNSSSNGQPHLASVTTPDGVISYAYDGKGNLSTVTYPDGASKTYHYEDTNFPHHLTGITDENGVRFANWSYDSNGKAISSEHAGGVERSTFTYNADGTTTVVGALGDTRTYHFEVQNGLRVVSRITGDQCTTCGNGFMQSRTYDANGFLSGYTDWNGNRTELVNNDRGLVIRRTEAADTPEERTTSTQWHPDFNLPTRITEPGRITDFTYNGSGQLLSRSITDIATGKVRITTFTYHPAGSNGAGLIASIDGPRTDVDDITRYAYDANDNLISITNALGHVTRITAHDPSGRPTTIIDANDIQTHLGYDARGRLLSIERAAGTADASTTRLTYDATGQITRITLGDGNVLDYGYDPAHRLTTVTDSLGNTIEYTLDAMGNRTKIKRKDPAGVLTQTQSRVFDQLSRLQQSIGAQNQITQWAYDGNHNPTVQTDALNRQSNNLFDALDQLIQATDPDQQQTGFSYDARGNLTSVTDAKGLTTTYTYNGFDDLISQTSPDTGTTTFTHDEAGNPISQTDARGITTTYSYDALNRLTQISYPDSSLDITNIYDENDAGQNGIGKLTTIIDASGTIRYHYDARGNLTQRHWQQTNSDTFIDYTYDTADRIVQITYPSGRTIDYTYSTAGQITTVTTTFNGETKILASNIGHLPFGPLNTMTYGNGLNYSANYDQDYQLDNQTTSGVQQRDYTQDNVGNISAITDLIHSNRNQTFGYDNLDRLNSATGGYGSLGYGYDPIGNRLNKTTDGNLTNYSYSNQSHHLQEITGSQNNAYQYDANGNTIDNGLYQFTYGDDNRLHSISQNGTEIARYSYNALGQRSSKTVAGTTIWYHYNQSGHLIAEIDATGNTQQAYAWLNGQLLALIKTQQSAGGGSTGPVALLNETSLSGIQGQALNYSFEVPANASNLNVLMQTASGDPDLYVRYGNAPTEDDYD